MGSLIAGILAFIWGLFFPKKSDIDKALDTGKELGATEATLKTAEQSNVAIQAADQAREVIQATDAANLAVQSKPASELVANGNTVVVPSVLDDDGLRQSWQSDPDNIASAVNTVDTSVGSYRRDSKGRFLGKA